MNILFLTLSNMEDINKRGIYPDLVREIANKGHNIFVVSPRQRRTGLKTELTNKNNINILKVRTGNITETNFIEKGFSTLLIEWQYLMAIKKYFKNVKFDMVMYSTPPITFEKVVKHFKKHQNSKTYLVLKDIFPQNAVDLGMMNKGGLLWKYFRHKEKKLYKISDHIGCMSQANKDYILEHNEFIDENKVEIFPNSIEPIARLDPDEKNKEILDKFNIDQGKSLFIYGGNLGKPQGIDFLLEVADNFHKVKNSHLMIIGSGTEYNKINEFIENNQIENVSLHERLPKDQYDKLLLSADVGLIFLDKRFTIPNFPSRLTAYMEHSIPILAATDVNTDLGEVIVNSGSGYWVESGDLEGFIKYANELALDENKRIRMGENARDYLENNFDINDAVDIILKHLG